MQNIFTAKGTIEEYASQGKNYCFPPAPLKRCHNPKCNKIVQYKKHGFYDRYLISIVYRSKILIRRYICPLCGCTLSYLPHFCLPGFIHALEHIFEYIYYIFYRSGTLNSTLSGLNKSNSGLEISRQLAYHYRKRFLNNLLFIQNTLRTVYKNVELPDENLKKEERAKKVLDIVKNGPITIHMFSQEFHIGTHKTFLTLRK